MNKPSNKPARIVEPAPAAVADESITEPAIDPATPTAQTLAEPAVDAVAAEIIEAEPLTPGEAVETLLGALNIPRDKFKALDVRAAGVIRILGTDNSARTRSFELPPVADEAAQ